MALLRQLLKINKYLKKDHKAWLLFAKEWNEEREKIRTAKEKENKWTLIRKTINRNLSDHGILTKKKSWFAVDCACT